MKISLKSFRGGEDETGGFRLGVEGGWAEELRPRFELGGKRVPHECLRDALLEPDQAVEHRLELHERLDGDGNTQRYVPAFDVRPLSVHRRADVERIPWGGAHHLQVAWPLVDLPAEVSDHGAHATEVVVLPDVARHLREEMGQILCVGGRE